MATNKTIDEQIKEVQKKQEQVLERREQYMKRNSVEQRKERTRRLIRIGALVEKMYGKPLTEEQIDNFYWFLCLSHSRLVDHLEGRFIKPKP